MSKTRIFIAILITLFLTQNAFAIDPFLSGWSYRIAGGILATTASIPYVFQIDLNSDTLGVNNTHFWANTLQDLNDVRFTGSDGITELDYFKYNVTVGKDANFYVQMPSLSVGDNNFYMYYGNATATLDNNIDVKPTKHDNFEDGDYTANPVWTVGVATYINNITRHSGNYSVMLKSNSDAKTTLYNFIPNVWYSSWFFWETDNSNLGSHFALSIDGVGYVTAIRIGHTDIYSPQKFNYLSNAGYNTMDGYPSNLADHNKAYFLSLKKDLENLCSAEVRDENGNLLSAKYKYNCNLTANPDSIYYYGATVHQNTYIDDCDYNSYLQYKYVFVGDYETPLPTITVIYPNGGEAFYKDINFDMNIQFTIDDNDSTTLTIDMNYSDTGTEGTGTPILTGASSATYCGITNPYSCTYDWNIVPIPIGSYYIIIKATDQNNNTNTDISDSFFIVYLWSDITPPTTTSNINDGNYETPPFDVVLSCIDTESGCALTQYRLDTDPTTNTSYGAWQTYLAPITMNTDGNYAIDYNSTDTAGNIETTKTQYILIQTPAPPTPTPQPSGISITPLLSGITGMFNIFAGVASGLTKQSFSIGQVTALAAILGFVILIVATIFLVFNKGLGGLNVGKKT